ncbi:MAG: hypothetical protein R3Y55_03685 [Rikenellaceae bacterium]
MTKEEIEEIARIAAVSVMAHKREIFNEEFDARYHDVELLLKNYRKLKAHHENASGDALEVSSICLMQRKTGLMMDHVEKMIVAYRAMCEESSNPEEQRKWQALHLRYIDGEKLGVDDIAEKLSVDKRTFYRDINRATEDLAVLLFGIEAIGSWKHKK